MKNSYKPPLTGNGNQRFPKWHRIFVYIYLYCVYLYFFIVVSVQKQMDIKMDIKMLLLKYLIQLYQIFESSFVLL